MLFWEIVTVYCENTEMCKHAVLKKMQQILNS
jgi:hypothetical protein